MFGTPSNYVVNSEFDLIFTPFAKDCRLWFEQRFFNSNLPRAADPGTSRDQGFVGGTDQHSFVPGYRACIASSFGFYPQSIEHRWYGDRIGPVSR